MLRPFGVNGSRIDEARLTHCDRVEQIARPVLKRSTKPGIDGNAEAHLGRFHELLRDVFAKKLAQEPFALTLSDFELLG